MTQMAMPLPGGMNPNQIAYGHRYLTASCKVWHVVDIRPIEGRMTGFVVAYREWPGTMVLYRWLPDFAALVVREMEQGEPYQGTQEVKS